MNVWNSYGIIPGEYSGGHLLTHYPSQVQRYADRLDKRYAGIIQKYKIYKQLYPYPIEKARTKIHNAIRKIRQSPMFKRATTKRKHLRHNLTRMGMAAWEAKDVARKAFPRETSITVTTAKPVLPQPMDTSDIVFPQSHEATDDIIYPQTKRKTKTSSKTQTKRKRTKKDDDDWVIDDTGGLYKGNKAYRLKEVSEALAPYLARASLTKEDVARFAE